ncbi:MAG: phosphotransferase, partial [Oscillospiraceae bacterium]
MEQLTQGFECVIAIAEQYGFNVQSVRETLQSIRSFRVTVPIIGAFNTGKSAMLNALLGSHLLLTGIVATTGAPTELVYGPNSVTVRRNGRDSQVGLGELRGDFDPQGVTLLHVSFSHPFLQRISSIKLVDLPGLDSGLSGREQLLRDYPHLGPLRSLHWHSPRPFSAAGLITTGTGTLFVKRHHQHVRQAAWLEEEHRLIAHLHRQGAPVAAVVSNQHGATATAQGEWTYEVHHVAEGLDLYRDALSWSPFQQHQHALAAGQALARLHQAAEHYAAPQRQTPVLLANAGLIQHAAPLENINSAYLADKDWHAQLSELLLPWHRELHPLLAEQPPLWTHNDWHASNLLWNADGSVSSVLDFGLADRTFALFDLATAIERNAVAWLDLDTGGVARADLD